MTTRLPLVFCTQRALAEAARFEPGVCFENRVEAEILAGNIVVASKGGGAKAGYVFDDARKWVARIESRPRRISPGKSWLVTEVQPHRGRK